VKRRKKPYNKEMWQKDIAFYTRIWEKSNRRCKITNRYLGDEPLTTFFHHILPKSRFPEYRWCEWNVIMLHPEVHAQVEIDIDRVPGARELYEKLLEKHLNGELLKCE